MTIFDSNIWVALFDEDDSFHSRAKEIVEKAKGKIILPEYIVLEVTTVLARKAGKSIADAFLLKTSANADIDILPSSQHFFEEVVRFYLDKTNPKLSFVDYSLAYLSSSFQIVTFDQILESEIAARGK